jgi:hypothetical protein
VEEGGRVQWEREGRWEKVGERDLGVSMGDVVCGEGAPVLGCHGVCAMRMRMRMLDEDGDAM